MSDYRQPGDPYGISEYTEQSATESSIKSRHNGTSDVRGNTVLSPRTVPTQAEVDAIVRGE